MSYNSRNYYNSNQTANTPKQWPFSNQEKSYRQQCSCRKELNAEKCSCKFRPPQNLNDKGCSCTSSNQNNFDENYVLNPCVCSSDQEYQHNGQYNSQRANSERHIQPRSVQTIIRDECICNNNEYENVEFQPQPRQGDMQLKCQCKACRRKVHAKFGLAWIVEGPGYENYEEPTGWQMEFIDTPSCVFQKCQEMIHWVNAPPIQTGNYITGNNRFTTRNIGYSNTSSRHVCYPQNQPTCICGQYHEDTGCCCEPKILDVEEQPVKDTQADANIRKTLPKVSSKQIVPPQLSNETSATSKPDENPKPVRSRRAKSEDNKKPRTDAANSADVETQESLEKTVDKPIEGRRKISDRRRAAK